jgi:hypothetical protein
MGRFIDSSGVPRLTLLRLVQKGRKGLETNILYYDAGGDAASKASRDMGI